MNNYTDMLELVDAYLQDKLSPEKREAFENELKTNPDLKEILDSQVEFYKNFQLYSQRLHLKTELEKFHKEIQSEKRTNYRPAVKRRSLSRTLQSIHFPTIAIAASVTLIAVWALFFMTGYLKNFEQNQSVYYKQLRRDLDKIKKYQSVIINDMQSSESKEVAKPELKFGGTAFALTNDGYIVTSYHVVKEARSIFIEKFNQGIIYSVTPVYKDKLHDLAILKVTDSTFSGFDNLAYTISDYHADLGEKVFTLGYPKEDIVYGEGSISSRTGFEGDTTSYQVSVPVNPGNSGGPLMDEKGNIIGVISGKHFGVESAAFAVKSSYLLNIINELKDDSIEVNIPKHNHLKDLKRPQQLKKIKDNVYVIKVYH